MNGKKINAVRKSLGLTQTEFGKLMKVSFATVNRWEGNVCVPLPDRMVKLESLVRHGKPLGESDEGIKVVGVLQIRRKGKWIDLHEVREGRAEVAWSIKLTEPASEIRILYKS